MEEKREPEQDSKLEEKDSKLEEKKEENKEGKGEGHQEADSEEKKEADDEEEDESEAKSDYTFWQKNLLGAKAPENPMLEHAFKIGKNFEANFSETFEKHQEKIMSKVTPQVEKLTTILQEQNPIPNLVQHFLNYALPRGPKPDMAANFAQAFKPQPSNPPKPVESAVSKSTESTATEEAPKNPSDKIAKNADA